MFIALPAALAQAPLSASPAAPVNASLEAVDAVRSRLPFGTRLIVQRHFRTWTEEVRIDPLHAKGRTPWTIFVKFSDLAAPVVEVVGSPGRLPRANHKLKADAALHVACDAMRKRGFSARTFQISGGATKEGWAFGFRSLPAIVGHDLLVMIDDSTGVATVKRGH